MADGNKKNIIDLKRNPNHNYVAPEGSFELFHVEYLWSNRRPCMTGDEARKVWADNKVLLLTNFNELRYHVRPLKI